MSEYFPNAPLVELAVEFRWTPGSVVGDPDSEPLDTFSVQDYDEAHEPLYRKLRSGLAAEGFIQSERLVPKGLPTAPFAATYRSLSVEDPSVLYHYGPGVLSVNAIPPYKNWEAFRPAVERGLGVLLRSWDKNEAEFSRISLRYIDAFSDEFLEGKSRFAFVTDVLGFGLSLPDVLANFAETDSEPDAFVQFSVPLRNGDELAARTGQATVSNEAAVVLDLAIHRSKATPATHDAVFSVLDGAHEIINTSFVEMTRPVDHVLRGQK